MNPYQLCQASIENLERLARFMGIPVPPRSPEQKRKLVAAILKYQMQERDLTCDLQATQATD